MAKYKLTEDGVRLGNTFIPVDSDHAEWRKYQEWLAQGNTPDPADPPPTPPAPEDTPLTAEDNERLWLQVPGFNRAKIATAKKDRGKPLP